MESSLILDCLLVVASDLLFTRIALKSTLEINKSSIVIVDEAVGTVGNTEESTDLFLDARVGLRVGIVSGSIHAIDFFTKLEMCHNVTLLNTFFLVHLDIHNTRID